MAAATSQARGGRRRWSETRVGRGLLFLGIAWSISGAFLVFQNGLPSLLAWAIGHGVVPPEWGANHDLPKMAAERCAALAVAEAGAPSTADGAGLQGARYAAFQMGRGFGLAAGASFSGLSDLADRVGPLLQEVRGQALALGVPAPELPRIRHMVTVLGEFADDLARDSQCTAARLASRYTPAHAHAYRFGVVVGYAALYCVNNACGALGAEVRRYGQAAGVPEWLWLPMARGSLDGVPGADAKEKTFRVLAATDEHIRSGR